MADTRKSKAAVKRKVRLHEWLNIQTLKVEYGLQILVGKKWHHVAENGVGCIFRNRARAERKMRALQNG